MSHFYGEIQGNRGSATRGGSKDSGFSAHIRGWTVGVKIWCYYDKNTGHDIIQIDKTGGSGHGRPLGTNKTIVFKSRGRF